MPINFTKNWDSLIPVIIQDYATKTVLMLGYMNEEAYEKTKIDKRVTFYSRSKQRLWTKGETSGNYLEVCEILEDCDQDTLLILCNPKGAVCHTGQDTCFGLENKGSVHFISYLESIISKRKEENSDTSYTSKLFKSGTPKIAQKVGEEAVELVIEALQENDENFKNEAADLLFHYLILLQNRKMTLENIADILKKRHLVS